MKVLVVDDDRISQKITAFLLERHGHQVTIASDGFEALNNIALCAPDLVLMDIEMPLMDGLEATRRIRNDDRHDGVPIVALTSLDFTENPQNLTLLGMNGYIPKPVNFEKFYEVVGPFLKREKPE